jgi:hypothetical protein
MKRRIVCQEEEVSDRRRRVHSAERWFAGADWRDRMGRYCKVHMAYDVDILDTD